MFDFYNITYSLSKTGISVNFLKFNSDYFTDVDQYISRNQAIRKAHTLRQPKQTFQLENEHGSKDIY